jgi:hypothetical protein
MPRGGDRLRHRGQPEDRVLGHGPIGLEVYDTVPLEMRDSSVRTTSVTAPARGVRGSQGTRTKVCWLETLWADSNDGPGYGVQFRAGTWVAIPLA